MRFRVVAIALLVATCGGSGDDVDQLATELVEETGGALDETQATCVAELLVESFGDDSFREVLDAAEGTGEAADDVRVEVIDIFASCDALDAVMLEADDVDEPDGDEGG